MNYSVRQYQPEDEKEIVRLLDEVFNGWPKFDLQCSPLDHWRWKFIDNPPKITVVSLAISDGKIIGSTHGLPQKLKIGEQIFLSIQSVDVATHPDFRRMGINTELNSLRDVIMKNAAIDFRYAVSSNPILVNSYKRAGAQALPFTLENLFRIRDIALHIKMTSKKFSLRKYGLYILKIPNRFKSMKKVSNKLSYDFKITKIDRFDEKIDEFWSQVRPQYKFVVERDRDYLNWRYCDPRGGNYVIKVAEAENKTLGYTVLRINRYDKEYPVGYIVDLLAPPDRPNVVSELAKAAVEFFDNENINEIQVNVLKGSAVESLFHGMGFINNPTKPFMNYSPKYRNDKLDKIYQCDVNNMHFVYGDHDWI